jgi:tRNA (guanine37-N1)-methyltransferase
MLIDVLTLFPEMFHGVLGSSILRRAAEPPEDGSVAPVCYRLTNIRDFSEDKHQKVDKPPFGGGPGMVLQCQPVWDAVRATEATDARPATRIVMTPQGRPLDQPTVEQLAGHERLLILAGHYEGFDERVLIALQPMVELSIGDYVLSGGELAAMVLIDAVVRLIPGVLGHAESAGQDSFSADMGGLLDHPHYTRPRVWRGMEVPPELLSGDHAKIARWRRQRSLWRTTVRRPDLLKNPPEDSA